MKKYISLFLSLILISLVIVGCDYVSNTDIQTDTESNTNDSNSDTESELKDTLTDIDEMQETPATENQNTEIERPETPASDFFYQERENSGIHILEYRGTDEHVVIPSKIDNIPVTVINFLAFRNAENLKSVVIPETVKTIDDVAFITCTNLTSFVVKDGNQNYSSHDGVLYNKDKTQIISFPVGKQDAYTIPNSVNSIREYAFYGCLYLKSISIPVGVESIGSRAFYDCPSLINITVDTNNKVYSSLNGVLYNKDQTQLVSVPGGKSGLFEVPNSVTEVEAYAFATCKSISSVKIPDSVTTIETGAFSKCSALNDITLPNKIKEISPSLFDGCTSLTNIVIPESVTKIDKMAFYKCEKLSNIELPTSLISIGDRAFYGCTSLSNIVIPENVESVGEVIFQECNHVNIYVKQESQPEGWASNWNHWNFTVEWGYTGSNL